MSGFYCAAWNADAVLRWEFCLSVRPSVCLSNACIVTKRKKNLSRFLYHAKDHELSYLLEFCGPVPPAVIAPCLRQRCSVIRWFSTGNPSQTPAYTGRPQKWNDVSIYSIAFASTHSAYLEEVMSLGLMIVKSHTQNYMRWHKVLI